MFSATALVLLILTGIESIGKNGEKRERETKIKCGMVPQPDHRALNRFR
jgi:hypothetical protein